MENDIDQEIQTIKNEVQTLNAQKLEIEKQIIIQDERIRSLKEQLLAEYGTDDEAELLKIKENLEKEIQELKEKINVETT
jgi:predicted  nucleic acid-binding Zn-ribbon protein